MLKPAFKLLARLHSRALAGKRPVYVVCQSRACFCSLDSSVFGSHINLGYCSRRS